MKASLNCIKANCYQVDILNRIKTQLQPLLDFYSLSVLPEGYVEKNYELTHQIKYVKISRWENFVLFDGKIALANIFILVYVENNIKGLNHSP